MNTFAILSCLCALISTTNISADTCQIYLDATSWQNDEDHSAFKAYNHLQKALELAEAIPSEEVRIIVCNELEACRNQYLNTFTNISERVTTLSENIDEILCECGDQKLRSEISFHISAMADELNVDQE